MPRQTPRRNRKFVSNSPDYIDNNPQQGAQLPPRQPTKGLGAEDARQIREDTSINTRYVDKPTPTSSKELLQQMRNRQQMQIQAAQGQLQPPAPTTGSDMASEVRGSRQTRQNTTRGYVEPQTPTASKELLQQVQDRQQRLNLDAQQQVARQRQVAPQPQPQPPTGRLQAPALPKQQPQLVKTNGSIRLGFGTAAVSAGLDYLMGTEQAQQLGDWFLDNTTGRLTGKPMSQVREENAQFEAYQQEVKGQDEYNAYREQYEREQMAMPIQPGEAPPAPVLPPEEGSASTQRRAKPTKRGNTSVRVRRPSPPTKEQRINKQYDQLRASNPEEAKEFGLAQHKELFPHLYK